MKKALAILIASTALTATIGFPAWSAARNDDDGFGQSVKALFRSATDSLPLVFVSDKHDDDDEHDDDHRRHHDDDDDDDDDDCDDCRGNARNPAPAGSVAPPKNGLFGNGTAPKVQTK
ncbi:hypothetical protein [Antarcticimicrobium sediminis]|uniref:Uncharacterized protein n=1 Tax=Antarcticimicrobium sediminis TaxID=2546227 RepID=A0A4R5EK49_9RHOB|nr:hypothetical protein [Antarcticimicrobium sediminis]TDE34812.1 hypothetical protein E1B25_18960 [Antarcticimicrobium sediminis]